MTQTLKRAVIAIALLVAGAIGSVWWSKSRGASRAPGGVANTVAGDAAPGSAMQTMANMPGMASMGTASRPASVQLTAGQIRHFGVTFGTVERRTMHGVVRTAGTVTFDETRLSQVAPRFGGFIESLYVDKTGEPVRQGDSLMAVYSPELVAAQQDLVTAAELQRTLGDVAVPGVTAPPADLVAAARRRLQLWDISSAQIDDVVRTREARRDVVLYAPASGIVLQKNVVRGQAMQAGQTLYTIANLDEVWIDVALREADAGAVRLGAAAAIEFASLAGHSFDGRVTYIYPTLDSIARTVRARVAVPNRDGLLKPGMYATVTLTSPARTALTVPTSAVFRTGERTLVFVDHGAGADGRAIVPVVVEVGETTGDYTEVVSGLQPGQQVATSAQFLLDSEANLGEVMKSMIGQMNASDIGKQPDMKDMPGMKMPSTRKK
jgi:Cu(I)/Ag(I) efflux system membrane fusion protein